MGPSRGRTPPKTKNTGTLSPQSELELPPKRGEVSLADKIRASERATLSGGGSSKAHFLGPLGVEQARKSVRGR